MRVHKLIRKIYQSPQHVTINELVAVADHLGVLYRRAGKHVLVFYRPGVPIKVTVPSTLKPYVVKQFGDLIWDLVPPELIED